MDHKLLLHHEVALLALSDLKGTFTGGMYIYSIAGAMVSELLLQQKIVTSDDKKQLVELVDANPVGDEVLDELIESIKTSKKPKSLKDWVFHAAKDLKTQTSDRKRALQNGNPVPR